MENLTHSLIGATLAEVALPKNATAEQRTLFFVTGIVAANLPDADLVYTRITPAPLGYLLHHRGHTHTVAGLVALAALIGLVALLPAVRRRVGADGWRYGLLVVAALASHLVADSWNSYGVHPFWPITSRWFYGDAIYILEPWLWMLLGIAVAMNTRDDRGRRVLAGVLLVLPIAAALLGVIAVGTLVPIASAAILIALLMRRRRPRTRAWMSIVGAGGFVAVSFVLSVAVWLDAEESVSERHYRTLVDIVKSPRPANPLCWNVLTIERGTIGDTLFTWRGTVDVGRDFVGVAACGRAGGDWELVATQSLAGLRRLASDDCSVRAWLQFGRAPVFDGEWIADARFGGSGPANFSAMRVATDSAGRQCPAHLTDWSLPRADLFVGGNASPPARAP